MPAYKRQLKSGLKWRYAGSHNGVMYCSRSIYPTKKEAEQSESDENLIEDSAPADDSQHIDLHHIHLLLKSINVTLIIAF